MSIGSVARDTLEKQLSVHGEACILRRLNETFDEDTGDWSQSSPPDDYPVYFVPEQYSDVLVASGDLLEGQRRILLPAKGLSIDPREGSESERADIVFFGDWSNVADVDADAAVSTGKVISVDKSMRYKGQQIGWILEVHSGGD